MFFTLLKQSWENKNENGNKRYHYYCNCLIKSIYFLDINLGLEVLNTALTLMRELNPLSLGSKAELPQIGLDCLDNVMHFVRECLTSDFIKNLSGKYNIILNHHYFKKHNFEFVIVKEQLAELSLLLAYQRESLIYLLEWIDMALNINDICLPFEKLYKVLEEMSNILTFAFGSEEFENYKTKSCISLKDVALLLMKKVIFCFMFQ